jgi:hypothetical protein
MIRLKSDSTRLAYTSGAEGLDSGWKSYRIWGSSIEHRATYEMEVQRAFMESIVQIFLHCLFEGHYPQRLWKIFWWRIQRHIYYRNTDPNRVGGFWN